jgi:hypothetical protein
MSARAIVFACVLPLLPDRAFAQESASPFHAATVVADYNARFQQLGDINGDGYTDAFSGWWWDSSYQALRISAFQNDGTGKLGITWTKSVPLIPSLTTTWAFVAGDVDGDGLDDLVVGAGIYVTLLRTGAGGAMPTSIAWPVPSFTVTGLALLDVDGDGVKEIAVLARNLTILRYSAASGGSLTPIGSLVMGANGGELRNANVDDRGTPDLIAWDTTHLWMIPMQGATPQTPTIFTHGCGDPRGAVGDIDNDGDEDVVVFDLGQYVLFRRTGSTTYVKEPMAVGGPARFLYDIDGDGFLDGVCCGGGGPYPYPNDSPSIFRVAMNDGTGHFAPALEFPGLGSVRLAGAADLDHDGDLDLVAGRCVYYSAKNFLDNIPRALPFTGGTPHANSFVDIDCDKDLDLEPGMLTQRNLGDGRFASFTPVLPAPPANKSWRGPGFPGDFDGDGDVDLVVSQHDASGFEQMELLKNAGGGSFVDAGPAGAPGVFFTASADTAPSARDVLVKDVDGDGDLDLVVMVPPASTRIFWNDGNGFFSPGPTWSSFLARHVADMNGDGVPDLVGDYTSSGGTVYDIAIYAGLGGGAFAPVPYETYFTNTSTGPLDTFDVGDADGDGDLDIVATNNDDLVLLSNAGQPGGAFNFQGQILVQYAVHGAPSGTPRTALFNDVDVDGKPDVVWSPVTTYIDAPNASGILRRKLDNSGYETPVCQVMMPTGALDLDGDGDADMFGAQLFKNRHFEGVDGGMRKQSDVGSIPGSSGITPTLGASGPFRVGEHAEMVLTGAVGGAQGLWYQVWLGDTPPPFAGRGHHQASPSLYYPPLHITTSGAPGVAGEGKWSLPFEVPTYIAGRTRVYHCDVYDQGAPNGIARSNKLTITYGP